MLTFPHFESRDVYLYTIWMLLAKMKDMLDADRLRQIDSDVAPSWPHVAFRVAPNWPRIDPELSWPQIGSKCAPTLPIMVLCVPHRFLPGTRCPIS